MSGQYEFVAVGAKQSRSIKVFTFAATAEQVLATCEISRVGRTAEGELFGFQRPQIAGHIQEIRDYLSSAAAVLPNAIVVGFLGGVPVRHRIWRQEESEHRADTVDRHARRGIGA